MANLVEIAVRAGFGAEKSLEGVSLPGQLVFPAFISKWVSDSTVTIGRKRRAEAVLGACRVSRRLLGRLCIRSCGFTSVTSGFGSVSNVIRVLLSVVPIGLALSLSAAAG